MSEVIIDGFTNIRNFVHNSVIKNSPLRLNRFVGKMDASHLNMGVEELSWNIYKINVPSLTIETDAREVDMIPKIYFKNWTYSDLEVSYLESADMKIRNMFYQWMAKILSPLSFDRKYYDDIKASYFEVMPIDKSGKSSTKEIFYEIVPCDINSIDFDMGDGAEQVVLTTIKFKYIGHEVLKIKEK